MAADTLPPLDSDYFALFGLDRKLVLDLDDLERRFYALSRRLHPDRFSGRAASDQQYSLDATALLNDAYRVLKQPVTRAEYLLTLSGLPISDQTTRDVPPELLEEVFEWNTSLEELKSGDQSARAQLDAARARFFGMQAEMDAQLQSSFAGFDQTGKPEILAQIRGVLNRRRYIRNLIRDSGQ